MYLLKSLFTQNYEWNVHFGVLRNDIYLWIMLPPELAIVRRNWLNDNIDKTNNFQQIREWKYEREMCYFIEGMLLFLHTINIFRGWTLYCVFCLKYETSTGTSQPTVTDFCYCLGSYDLKWGRFGHGPFSIEDVLTGNLLQYY